jgi:hypothetical protein
MNNENQERRYKIGFYYENLTNLSHLSRPRSRLDAYISVFLLFFCKFWKNTLFNE